MNLLNPEHFHLSSERAEVKLNFECPYCGSRESAIFELPHDACQIDLGETECHRCGAVWNLSYKVEVREERMQSDDFWSHWSARFTESRRVAIKEGPAPADRLGLLMED